MLLLKTTVLMGPAACTQSGAISTIEWAQD
jgi:hypothetical protein